MGHPQSNGEVKVTNRTIFQDLIMRLTEIKRFWVDELYSIFWAYRTTPQRSTEEIPFKLIFGIEAVTPVEIDLSMIRIESFHKKNNSNSLRTDLDVLEKELEFAW